MINYIFSCNLILDSNKSRRKDDVIPQMCCYHAIFLDFCMTFRTYWMILTKQRYRRHEDKQPLPNSNQEHGIFMVHISNVPSSLDLESYIANRYQTVSLILPSVEFSFDYEVVTIRDPRLKAQ